MGIALLLAAALCPDPAEAEGPERWEPQIQAFEELDQDTPPPQNAVLFIGSSSIRGWNLSEYFPELAAINRGFGGSQIADSTFYVERIVVPCRPRLIVLYAGDNDIAAGKRPEQVAEDFGLFARKVRESLPETPILFLAIKPSIKRWALVDKMRQANQLVEQACEADESLQYVDVATPMLGEDGRPRQELYAEDGLHLSAEGYTLWTQILGPYLKPEAGQAP